MIISNKYKYVFVEIPRTGSSAISKELREKYDGEEILHKHANYQEFLKIARPEQKDYFVFAGIRNPLDESVSFFSKLLTNHRGHYTDETQFIENGGWISKKRLKMFLFTQRENNYGAFLKKFYKLPYTSNISANKKYCDYIIRFENLDSNFTEVLKKLKIKKLRKLPQVNRTHRRKDHLGYYSDVGTVKHATRVFGPFMEEWEYDFPKGWHTGSVSPFSKVLYATTKTVRTLYLKYVKGGPLKQATLIRNMIE